MVFEILNEKTGLWFNILPCVAFGGLKWQRSDIDGPSAGRGTNGDVIRDRIAIKIRWDVTCRPVTGEEQSKILQLIEPEFVTLKYLDPVTNGEKTGIFYSNNFPTGFGLQRKNGVILWTGLTFPLIQK